MTNLKRSFAAAIGALGARKRMIAPTPKAPTQLGLRRRMLPGDRIAIKKRLGNGSNTMKIRALGIITKVDQDEEHRVDVDWLLTHLDRDDVPLHGCAPAINGPYTLDDDDGWLLRVFYI